MIVRINLSIEAEPGEQSRSYGQMNFNETVSFQRADFEIIAAIFTRCHELLHKIREEFR